MIYEGLLLIFFLIMMKKSLPLKNICISRLEYKNQSLFNMTRTAEKLYSLAMGLHIYLYSPYKGVPSGIILPGTKHIEESN